MSDSDVEEVAEQSEEVTDGDQPSMDAEEIADADIEALAAEIEEDTAPEPDTTESEDTETASAESSENTAESTDGDSYGDMYVGTLTGVSNLLIEEHGKPDAEPIDEAMARQLDLGEHVDDWMAKRGKSDMPPEQAVLISTTLFLVAVLGSKTELPTKLLEEADF